MRSFISLAALVSVLVSASMPALAQRLIKPSPTLPAVRSERGEVESKSAKGLQRPIKPQPAKSKGKTEFEVVEAFSDGNGTWIRWRMEAEVANIGFRVYRLGTQGETPVSEFIPGSYFMMGDRQLLGGEYNYFDPKGSQDAAYFVETLSAEGKTKRTNYFVPTYVESIDAIPAGKEVKTDALTPKAGDNKESQKLDVNSELKSEMQLGLLSANPSRHREVISTAGGVRISSKGDGLIRVTKGELQSAGFDVNSDAGNWQLYLDGVELPIIVGPNSDYIEYLGKSINTLESDLRTYYLIPGVSAGKRIQSQSVRPPLTNSSSKKYDQTFVREDKKVYAQQVLNGEAENWWGDIVSSAAINYQFSLSGVDRTPGTRKVTVAIQGLTTSSHVVELTLNGTVLPNLGGNGHVPFQGTFDVPVSVLLDGTNTLQLRAGGPSPDVSLLRRVSIEFPRSLVAMGNKLNFYTENSKNAKVSGFSSPNVRVFDVTYEDTPRLLTNIDVVQTNGTWGPVIPAARPRVLYAVEAANFGTAISVTQNDPAVLEDPANVATMVIISHPSLMTQANAWAAYRTGQGVTTKVVDVNEIYDEFSYGVLSSQAIEDFLLYAKNNWQTPPSYVLLIGDGHYDSKNYQNLGYWNMIPSRFVDTLYMETGSDEALSDFNHDGLAEIPIGRIAARDGASVTNMLNKTITWEASLNANSMNRGVLFAHDWPDGYDFHAMSDRLMSNLPASVPKLSISQTTAGAQASIIAAVNEADGGTTEAPGPNAGQYLLNYTGHGTTGVWRNTAFFSFDQADDLFNGKYPSLMVSLSCLNAYFMSNNDSFAEAMTKVTGGAVAVWASTGETTPDVQEIMGTRFYTKLGEGSIPRIGDLIKDAKGPLPAQADVRLSWALIGDPMLKVR